MNKQELNKLMSVLEIEEDIENVNVRVVNKAFRKLAKKVHPDKAGDEKTAAFQKIKAAYDILKAYFEDEQEPCSNEEDDDEERFFMDNFDQFNFPFENKGSFTVAIECWLADTWQKYITELLGEPKVKINAWGTECDRFWKIRYNEIDITVHIWNKPKNKKGSKLMIQGSRQSVLCSYVFEELPKIYKLVCLNKPERIESSYSTRRIPGKPLVKCDQCKYKSTLLQMKMHMKTVHVTKPKRNKRSPNFTPVMKPATR